MRIRLDQIALRAASGAFILNSGLGISKLNPEQAAGLQEKAMVAFPQLKDMPAEQFGKLLGFSQIGLGSALLLPFIPGRIVGLALTAFAGGLVAMYLKTPGMTKSDGIRPTPEGIPLAKDFWLLAIGIALTVAPIQKKGKKASAKKIKNSLTK